jgi:hypothetical protein
VGVQDNFFDLGGHSLIATKILAAIQDQFHVRLEPRALFDNSTIEELALTVTEALARNSGFMNPCLLLTALWWQVQFAL